MSAAGIVAVTSARASANERIRTAIIGLNNRGPQVAAAMIKTGQFDIVTLCDCDTSMFDVGMKELGGKLPAKPKLEADYRKVYEDRDIDAVVIATPDHSHALLACQAFDAGKHIYLEKPASYNIHDGQMMVAAQQKHPDRVLAVGTQQRSGQHFIDAKAFIDGGGLGKIAFARAWISHSRDKVDRVPDSEPPASLNYDMWLGPAPMVPFNKNRVHYNWRFIRDYGTGEMGNWGAHWIDTVRWLVNLDLPSSAAGAGGTFVTHDAKEWPDTQTVIYQFPDLTLLWELRLWTEYGVNGMSGGAEIGGDKGTLIINRRGWEFFPTEGPSKKHGGSELEVAHAKNFAEAIQGKAKTAIDIVDGHKTATVCHLGNISVALNRQISFDPKTETFPGDEAANALARRDYRAPWTV